MGWREEIRIFDVDLRERMSLIIHHEVSGFDLELHQQVLVQHLLGFPDRYHFPWWRCRQTEWRSRNRDRWNSTQKRRYQERVLQGWRKRDTPEGRRWVFVGEAPGVVKVSGFL